MEEIKKEKSNESEETVLDKAQEAQEEVAATATATAGAAPLATPLAPPAATPVKEPTEEDYKRENLFGPNFVPRRKKGFKYGVYLFIKRTFDIVSSGLMMLILALPILICLLIKFLEDFHNPIYVSKRMGKDGRIFNFYKIRTMCPNAEDMKQALIDQGLNDADGPTFKLKDDPRITKVGKFYRKFSIDELLQLINVFNGTLSVVGPRSPLPKEVVNYTEEQKHKLDVKGGLLCLWQIQPNRNDISFDDWLQLDLEYIAKQSIWLDLKIIFKGAYMVLFDHSGV